MSRQQLSDYLEILGERGPDGVTPTYSEDSVSFSLEAVRSSAETPDFVQPEVAEAWRLTAAGLTCVLRGGMNNRYEDPKTTFIQSVQPRLHHHAKGRDAFIGPAAHTLNGLLTVVPSNDTLANFGIWTPQTGVHVLAGSFEQIYPKN